MKKLLLVILIISMIACKIKQPTPSTETHPNAPINSESVEISENTARLMTHRFRPHAIGFRNQTRTVWLSVGRVKLLYDVLKYDSEHGINTDGLRIYFAKYPAKDPLGNNYLHAYRNTLVFVSTKDSTIYKGKDTIIYHRDYFNGASVRNIEKQSKGNSTNKILSAPENKGELCPPGDCAGALLLKNN